jgi:hypothetical protein
MAKDLQGAGFAALPGLSREALHRIAEAEKRAMERYDEDKVPYFPLHPDFSFLEGDIFRCLARVIEFLRIYADDVLDAHLREYLENAPSDLLLNETLLRSIAENVGHLTDTLWTGYGCTLRMEPASRRARLMIAKATGTMGQHPELEPWKYPDVEGWAEFIRRMAEPDSPLARLNARYEATIKHAIVERIRHYQHEAAAKLGLSELRPRTKLEVSTPDAEVAVAGQARDGLSVGALLAAKRKQKGWTQARMGRKLGCSTQSVANHEAGRAFPARSVPKYREIYSDDVEVLAALDAAERTKKRDNL